MNKAVTSKEVLLEIARDIAYHEGIGKLNIRRVAADGGVAIGTVYNYYPSKGDLISDVMEDFWRNVFHGSHFDVESDDFLLSLQEIYRRLKENLSRFRQEFLEEVTSMNSGTQMTGKTTEQFYLDHMKAGMQRILERDPQVRCDIWNETFTQRQFVAFAFSNMISLLKEPDRDFDYFEEIIKRLIY